MKIVYLGMPKYLTVLIVFYFLGNTPASIVRCVTLLQTNGTKYMDLECKVEFWDFCFGYMCYQGRNSEV